MTLVYDPVTEEYNESSRVVRGYHGTIFPNLRKGVDMGARIYDKSRVDECAEPIVLDLSPEIPVAVKYLYFLVGKVARCGPEEEMRLAVLLEGERVSPFAMRINKIYRFLFLLEWYLDKEDLEFLDDITDSFFANKSF